jgi:hypothetical protein
VYEIVTPSSPRGSTSSCGGRAFGIVARTSSWILVSTVSRNCRVPPATEKKAGYRRGNVFSPAKTPNS